jgi:hypothetical protein
VLISQALTGETVGLFPLADDVWLVNTALSSSAP